MEKFCYFKSDFMSTYFSYRDHTAEIKVQLQMYQQEPTIKIK